MWKNSGGSDRLTTPPVSNATDHFNNNPYSRNSSIGHHHSAVPKAQENSDPWGWGWDDNGSGNGQGSSGQDENELWGTQPQSHLHQPQQQLHSQQKYNTGTSVSNTNNSSEFFESVDLKSSNNPSNNIFNHPTPSSQYHYSHQLPPQQQQQPNFLQQQAPPPPLPQISSNSSYSYFQFSEPQQAHSMNSTSLGNQYPSAPFSQSQAAYNNYPVSNYPPPLSLPIHSQFMQTHNYNQIPISTPFSQQQTSYTNSSTTSNNMNSNSIVNNNNNNNISTEVENREIAPPEKIEKHVVQTSTSSPPPVSLPSSFTTAATATGASNIKNNNSIVPENQETVPENEERPPDPDTISSTLNNLRLSSPPASELTAISTASNDLQQWNSASGWENQEVAPRFTVDRDQYLETGHLHPPLSELSTSQQSSPAVHNEGDADTNDEGEAVPPPGLHRLVTGQGQSVDQERLVLGSPPPPLPSSTGSTTLLQRPQVPGHSMQPSSDLSSHPLHPPLGQRMIPGQLRDDDMERMVLGSSGNSTNDNLSGTQQPREQLQSSSVLQRTVPGGRSNDMPQNRDQPTGDHVSQRTVPAGSSTSSSSAGSNSSYSQLQDLPSEERLVLGRPTIDQGDDRLQPQQSSSGVIHNVVVSSSSSSMWAPGSAVTSHQDTIANHMNDTDLASQQPPRPPSNNNSVVGAEQSRSNSLVSDPPPGLHRMVVGHPDNNISRGGSVSGDETSQSSVPPPGFHRMVLGEQQQEQKQQQADQQQQSLQSTQQHPSRSQGSNADNEDCGKDREIDSDSDYHINRRKQQHRRDSVEEDNYTSDRERERDRRHLGPEYWDRRYGERSRRHVKDRSLHPSYDHSPEYRSEEDLDRERNDYRDHRDYRPPRHRDRDRERERGERRRQSPDYYYRDDDYRDDERRPGRGGRYYEPHHYRNRDMYEDDYYYHENRSSRPSSRSGMDFSRRPGGPGGSRDFMPPRNMHSYYQDQGAYQMHYYQLQQRLYEMRRNDPQAYAAWYEQYMASKYGQSVHHPDDSRTSLISGRSSANQHRTSNEKVLMDETIGGGSNKGILNASGIPGGAQSAGGIDNQMIKEGDDIGGVSAVAQRYTPQLYPGGAHIKGKWSKQGQLVVISPNYPREGQPPIVEIMQLSYSHIKNDPDILEFLESPGPFIVGVTHKNTVLQYLKKRGDQASHNAEKLLYDLMQLVIRLNGVVDMTDVADLLMNNYNEDPGAEHDQNYQPPQQFADAIGHQDNNDVHSETSAQQVTDRFRDLLLQGNKLEALEWAMQNKNWGHAFFLASKMDPRSYNNVMLRFANGLPPNDPLQTLYQMMSGREPQAATCCADKKWGDWRPHLAMMLSNPSGNPDLDRKSIITLGDSLAGRGRLFASHFCYVTAQVDFTAYTDRCAKLVLLGSSHLQPFAQFATCRSIMLTLCYEYAKRLNKKDLTIPALQVYKYLLATRLIENGRLALASQYLEAIALDMVHRPTRQNRQLALLVAELADQIKLADPALAMINDPNDDPDWLNMLKQILDDTNDTNLQTSSMSHGISTSTVSTSAADPPPVINQVVGGYGQDQVYYDNSLTAWNQPETQPVGSMQYSGYPSGQNIEIVDDQYGQHQYLKQQQEQPLQHPEQNMMQPQSQVPDIGTSMNLDYMSNSMQQTHSNNSNSIPWDPLNNVYGNSWQGESQAPQMPPVTTNNFSTATITQEQTKATLEKKSNKDESSSRRAGKKNKEQSSSGWFGGIWDKISFKPKNAMILPDDKNPSIVWDEKRGRWINKDADDEDESLAVKPPPKASELPGFSNPPPPPAAATTPPSAPVPSPMAENSVIHRNIPPAASTPNSVMPTGTAPLSTSSAVNQFKMRRGRGMKANYIDVMNPNSRNTNNPAAVPAPMIDPVPTATAPINNFFIPAPVEGIENAPVDFVSPSGPVSYEASHKGLDQSNEKNYSSQDVPTFYNPNSYTVT